VAITLPPLVVLLVDGFYRRYGDHPALQGFVRGLSLAVSGIFFVVLAGIMKTAGWNVTNLMIALGAIGLGATRRVPVLLVLALAALAGILVN
jgi:chromate transport protein ChrA